MKKLKSPLLIMLLMLAIFSLSACFNSGLNDIETVNYQNAAGYSLDIPADWQLLSEEPKTTTYTNAEGTAALLIINELGGESYYPLNEIAEMIGQNLLYNLAATNLDLPTVSSQSRAEIMGSLEGEALEEMLLNEDEPSPEEEQAEQAIQAEMAELGQDSWHQSQIIIDRDNAWRSIWQHQAADSIVIADLYIERPLDGMRYYLILISGLTEHQALEAVYGGIIGSFEIDAERAELYQAMSEQRDNLGAFDFEAPLAEDEQDEADAQDEAVERDDANAQDDTDAQDDADAQDAPIHLDDRE